MAAVIPVISSLIGTLFLTPKAQRGAIIEDRAGPALRGPGRQEECVAMLRANDRSIDCGLRLADCGFTSARQFEIRNPKSEIFPARSSSLAPRSSAFTLVEMLVAMAITLVMMGAVVTLFANVSNSVRDRRAVIEISGQLRHARNMLQQDLQGATCPGLTWRRPEENQGYIEIIEGPYREGNASALLDYNPTTNKNPPAPDNPEIDHTTSVIPTSNLLDTKLAGKEKWVTDGAALGDGDDVLMLTVRNDHEPFVGNMPAQVRVNSGSNANSFVDWTTQTIESPLAEVVWYAVENPGYSDLTSTDNYGGFFGEPGMRTIYRRTLLIAPWVNPYRFIDNTGAVSDTFVEPGPNGGKTFNAQPGLVRTLKANISADQAIASLIAFQERYDLSVRLEFDPLLDSPNGRWKIVANTLGDLTKRENRYEHHSYRPVQNGITKPQGREFPFAAVSAGSNYTAANVLFAVDPEYTPPTAAVATANLQTAIGFTGIAGSYNVTNGGSGYKFRPFAYLSQKSDNLATARAMLNDNGEIVRVVQGLAPLSGSRRGEDVMLSDALAFDLRVYDPGAPLFGVRDTPVVANSDPRVVLEPTDPAWAAAYTSSDNMGSNGKGSIGNNNANAVYPFVGQGAYVDLGYGYSIARNPNPGLYVPQFASAFSASTVPWFFAPPLETQMARAQGFRVSNPGALTDVYGIQMAPGYAVYDTWSFHYENDGVNEDTDEVKHTATGDMWERLTGAASTTPLVDQGTNGLDDFGHYYDPTIDATQVVPAKRNGPDDVGERETSPPYDKPLRGMQVIMRVYERDSRQIRQVSVNQHFVPE